MTCAETPPAEPPLASMTIPAEYLSNRVFPGSATLQRGFWSRAGARRSQERALVQDLRNGHLVYGQGFDDKEGICMSTLTVDAVWAI
jgi:hypothetical protein